MFLQILSEDKSFIALMDLLEHSQNIDAVLDRVRSLTDLQFDYRYENPYDVALAAYAWAVAKKAPDVARIVASVLTNARQTWWARETAQVILEEYPLSASDDQTKNEEATAQEFLSTDFIVRFRQPEVLEQRILSGFLVNLQKYDTAQECSIDLRNISSWSKRFEGIAEKPVLLSSMKRTDTPTEHTEMRR